MLSINKSNYVDYSSSNYGAHAMRLDIGTLSLWFSYDTVIAFRDSLGNKKVRVNSWSTTTGKHLNAIDGGSREAKKNRLSSEAFENELNKVLVEHNLQVN